MVSHIIVTCYGTADVRTRILPEYEKLSLAPWTNVSLDKILLGLMSLGQSGPWTTVPWTNVSTPTNQTKNTKNRKVSFCPQLGTAQP